ncbi:DUF4124 domain-containing protein [Halieaceae bacterium IMCC14734]|uniref:DUF4124 domain-containing protein n=1 Tax=Candidatus Litorirhabdus singularis TaxID=2518993 RepID=A0ABT3TLV9_9GAMM|nr:DUF4124 domain-containing protein [Candidatus Litorirhabdus singularis]MCX2982999.1 DUF4124 domain-containing protein [Candidatus Litorirhabdus singularis]
MLRSTLLCLILASSLSHASTVYRTIDSAGRVTYSDQPPLDKSNRVETLHYRETPVKRSAEDSARFAAMREVTAKITESRIVRENARFEQKTQAPVYSEVSQPNYGPQRGSHRYKYPQYHHQPRWDLIGQPASNSQYPAKLVRQHYSDHVQRALQPNQTSQLPNWRLPARPVPLR